VRVKEERETQSRVLREDNERLKKIVAELQDELNSEERR
jgi:hypothetical protein